MPDREILSASALNDDREVEVSLRPRRLADYVGQERIVDNLKVFIQAAKGRGEALDHVFLFGPPGLGKTTLASIIANEMEVPFKSTSGPVLERAGDLVNILMNLEPKQVLFIDEIHRLPADGRRDPLSRDRGLPGRSAARSRARGAERQGRLAAVHAGGRHHARRSHHRAAARALRHRPSSRLLPSRSPGAHPGALGASARHRARRRGRLDHRGTQPRHAARRQPPAAPRARLRAGGGRGPRSTRAAARRALDSLEVDELGFDEVDRKILTTLIEHYQGGPAGIQAIAAAIGEDRGTLEDIYEPFLIQEGFLQRTPRGRVATERAYRHLGIKTKSSAPTLF